MGLAHVNGKVVFFERCSSTVRVFLSDGRSLIFARALRKPSTRFCLIHLLNAFLRAVLRRLLIDLIDSTMATLNLEK